MCYVGLSLVLNCVGGGGRGQGGEEPEQGPLEVRDEREKVKFLRQELGELGKTLCNILSAVGQKTLRKG